MENDFWTVLSQGNKGGAGAQTGQGGTAATTVSGRSTVPANPVLEALTQRLLGQTQGVSSSATSNLQRTINEAIAGTQQSGDLTTQRLQSERSREVAFMQDRNAAQYTNALESRSGYATQIAGLRELTETTEKSVRDLDQRYQEAILANDANTAKAISDLRIQKLAFQQEQEQNYFNNLISVAGMHTQTIGQMMQNEQFWAGQEQAERQFVTEMAQSQYQFNKNLAIQYKEIGLQEQELDIARERNQISWAELAARKAELKGNQNNLTTQMFINQRLMAMKEQGVNLDATDKLQMTGELYAEIITANPNFSLDQETFSGLVNQGYVNAAMTDVPPIYETQRSGGLFSGAGSELGRAYGNMFGPTFDLLLGSKQQVRVN